MQRRKALKWIGGILACVLGLVSLVINLGLLFAQPINPGEAPSVSLPPSTESVARQGDEQLAYLLVKLMLETRKEIGGHFTRKQSPIPGISKIYQRMMVKNRILPAAVADRVFAETVPSATGGRAWVKMVVDKPRNPNNRADEVAGDLLAELRQGESSAQQETSEAIYYAEPIKAKRACLFCHGEPKGSPDPFFSEFVKEGWREGDVIGAVVARVVPEKRVAG